MTSETRHAEDPEGSSRFGMRACRSAATFAWGLGFIVLAVCAAFGTAALLVAREPVPVAQISHHIAASVQEAEPQTEPSLILPEIVIVCSAEEIEKARTEMNR